MIYQEMLTQVIEKMRVQPDTGLTDAQVQEAREKYGDNRFVEPPKEGLVKKVIRSL